MRTVKCFTTLVLRNNAVDIVGDAGHGVVHPRVVPGGCFVFPREIECVRAERPVAQPAVVVLRKVGRGDDCPVRLLITEDRLDASLHHEGVVHWRQLINH